MVDTTYVWAITCDCFVFSYILFSILPTICDIIIAIIYFVSYFNVWFGLIVFTCMVLYLSESNLISNWDQYYQINHRFHWNKFNCDLETTEDKQLYFLLSSHFWIVSKASIKAHIPKPWPSNTVWCEGGRCMPMCVFIIVVWSAGLACNLQMALLCVITQSNLTDIFLDSLCLKFVWRQVLKSTQTETKTRPVPVLWCMTDSC